MARSFDGSTSNYLQVGDVTAIDLTGNNVTISAWVNFNSVATEQALITKWGTGAANTQYDLELFGSKVTLATSNGTNTTVQQGSTAVAAGKWNHFCGVQSGAAIFVYLNGVQDGTGGTPRSMTNTTAVLQFGKFQDAGLALNGLLAECAIWATNLSGAEVAQLAAGANPMTIQAASLRGYWPLCGRGTPEPDLVNGNQAAINGTLARALHPLEPSCGEEQTPDTLGLGGLW